MAERAVLVTGGTGFVGGAIVAQLAKSGRRVIATATEQPRSPGFVRWNAAQSLLPEVDWDDIDAVVHAALPRNPFAAEVAAEVRRVSVDATAAMLDKARRFILVSTGDVLGGSPEPALETARNYAPSTPYGQAKAEAEQLALAAASSARVAVVRLFHPYGPGGDRFVINRVLRAVATGEEVTSSGILLNPLWIGDLAEGFERLVAGTATGVFHFAGPDLVTFDEMVTLMAELAGVTPRISRIAPGVAHHAGDYSRAAAEFDFRPRVRLRDGLGMMLGCAMGAKP